MSLRVAFAGISKDFGAVRVLHDVRFELAPGKVYGLLGENGAGKSTLMKILAGYETASEGELTIDGVVCRFADSRAAEAAGVVLIHQEFNLADDLTVAQNIFLGRELKRGWLLDDAAMRSAAREVLREVGLEIDPDTLARELIVAEKQLVEIAKALSRRARLLVMDEPTATLTPSETERLFQLIARLKAAGTTIVYISHKLEEVERITDEIVVMRDGRFASRAPTADVSRHQMANLMVGRELSDMFPARNAGARRRAGAARERPHGARLGERGELRGARRRDRRLRRPRRCRPDRAVRRPARPAPAQRGQRRARGPPGLVPQPARRRAARPDVSQRGSQGQGPARALLAAREPDADGPRPPCASLARPALRTQGARRRRSTSSASAPATRDVSAAQLSGGNQQKLAIAKVLQPGPRVVVLDEPTRGVDVGAKRDIYFLIQRLAAAGRAVIVISSELIELIGLCHRVVVMRGGRLQATLPAEGLTEEALIAHATGTH